MSDPQHSNGWRRFWHRGTWWKALLLVVGYWLVYQLIGLGTSALFHDVIDAADPLSSPASIFFGVALPILLSGLLLIVLAASLGWARGLFRREPLPGRRWMWLAVLLVLIPIVLRLIGTRWSAYAVATVLAILALGLCVGFAEELLTRGFVVNILRSGGYGERAVLVLSASYFAIMHAGNALQGQPLSTVLGTVVYTFGFGALMYLSLRVTGRLVWAILLHAATDPTTILATGGIDAHNAATAGTSGLIGVAGIFSFVYVAFALVAIFLVTNRTKVAPVAPATSD